MACAQIRHFKEQLRRIACGALRRAPERQSVPRKINQHYNESDDIAPAQLTYFLRNILLAKPLQIPIRRHANQKLVVDALVDLELRMALEPFMNGCFGVVANLPGAIGEGSGG